MLLQGHPKFRNDLDYPKSTFSSKQIKKFAFKKLSLIKPSLPIKKFSIFIKNLPTNSLNSH